MAAQSRAAIGPDGDRLDAPIASVARTYLTRVSVAGLPTL
jgi:hypothetical protein